ncbi:MAG: hypothetical protein C0417_02020 [Chlorobiaceae bacterium]|nr:hypothetical protein [Chlorobiaceae bacterium]
MVTFQSNETKRILELQGLELTSFTRRAIAFIADLIFASVLFAIVASLLEPLLLKLGWISSDKDIVFALNLNWYSVAWIVIYFGILTYIGRGKTPGKKICGIRVISLVHNRISLWHSIERALGYGASLLELGFGFIQYFIHPNKRTVHDRIAESIVVREKYFKKNNK